MSVFGPDKGRNGHEKATVFAAFSRCFTSVFAVFHTCFLMCFISVFAAFSRCFPCVFGVFSYPFPHVFHICFRSIFAVFHICPTYDGPRSPLSHATWRTKTLPNRAWKFLSPAATFLRCARRYLEPRFEPASSDRFTWYLGFADGKIGFADGKIEFTGVKIGFADVKIGSVALKSGFPAL
jgi:hypothetical protein